jgi:predicted phosphodiesterase
VILCAAGDTHGALDRLYDDVLAFEQQLGVRFDQVVHVGDFGIWPDPERLDRATRERDGVGDFAAWLASGRIAPRPTTFIKGNHEDFDFLAGRRGQQVLPGVTYLGNGETMDIGGLRVGGIGGCYAPSDFERPARTLEGKARAHYTRDECDRIRRCDVLLLHDAPSGVDIAKRHRDGSQSRYVSTAVGLADVVRRVRPKFCFFGHHHASVLAQVGGVSCIGLNLIGRTGHLVAVDVGPGRESMKILGSSIGNWQSHAGIATTEQSIDAPTTDNILKVILLSRA